jgi:hypothetical protein
MEFALHTESFDLKFPLLREVEQMQEFLYTDIPIEIRAQYCEYEKIWTTQRELAVDTETAPPHLIPLTEEYVTTKFPLSSLVPVGINSHIAIGLSNMTEWRASLIAKELEQYHIFWNAYLRRCRYKVQFNDKQRQLMANPDVNLRRVVEMIMRDEELIKFRDNLPEVLDDEEGLDDTIVERENSAVESVAITEAEASFSGESGSDTKVYAFYYQRYMNKRKEWKVSNHVFASIAPPAYSVCELFLLYAFYESATSCVVRLCGFDQKKPVCEWRATMMHPSELHASVNNIGWMAVSDGTTVYQKHLENPIIYRHTIEHQTISTIHLDEYGYLFIGTHNGQIYDISPFKIRSYTMDREQLSILNISTSGGKRMCAQTINGINIPSNQKQLIIMRPVTSIIRGPLVLFLTKYGTLKIRSTVHNHTNIDLPILKGMAMDIDALTPWYDRGIFFNGKMCSVLYPDGSVLVRSI